MGIGGRRKRTRTHIWGEASLAYTPLEHGRVIIVRAGPTFDFVLDDRLRIGFGPTVGYYDVLGRIGVGADVMVGANAYLAYDLFRSGRFALDLKAGAGLDLALEGNVIGGPTVLLGTRL